MLLLTKVVLSLMIGFITSVIFGFVLIPFLKKINFGQRISDYVGENHHKKEGTPTMGGIIIMLGIIITEPIKSSILFQSLYLPLSIFSARESNSFIL